MQLINLILDFLWILIVFFLMVALVRNTTHMLTVFVQIRKNIRFQHSPRFICHFIVFRWFVFYACQAFRTTPRWFDWFDQIWIWLNLTISWNYVWTRKFLNSFIFFWFCYGWFLTLKFDIYLKFLRVVKQWNHRIFVINGFINKHTWRCWFLFWLKIRTRVCL